MRFSKETNPLMNERKNKHSIIAKLNIAKPWDPKDYFRTVRGAENFHIYLWVLKDLGNTNAIQRYF
jgi:hypothetical protein